VSIDRKLGSIETWLNQSVSQSSPYRRVSEGKPYYQASRRIKEEANLSLHTFAVLRRCHRHGESYFGRGLARTPPPFVSNSPLSSMVIYPTQY
jgi:hypothetical protein